MIFAACVQLRGNDTHIFSVGFVSAGQDLPSYARAFSLTAF